MLIGTRLLNRKVTRFAKKFGFNCKCKLDTDFAYLYDKNLILYSLVLPEESNKEFMEFCYRMGLEHKVDVFVVSLIHEFGHIETYDDLTDLDLKKSINIKNKLSEITDYSTKDYLTYFKCPDECAATLWAIDFINDNIDDVLKFQNNILKSIKQFYKINRVDNN